MKAIIDKNTGQFFYCCAIVSEISETQIAIDQLPQISYDSKFETLYWDFTDNFYYKVTNDIAKGNLLALHVYYPEVAGMPYKLLQLDNLEGIKRDSTLADKGLKGEKKYRKNDQLIWSSEKKYWFQPDGYPDGFRRVTKLFKMNGEVADQWENFYELSADDKEFFKKQQRELIFEYFKSQQPELFNLLYSFFKEEIDRYVMKDGPQLAETLSDAAVNHPFQDENGIYVVRQTLSSEIPTQSNGTITVLQGILAELV